jgi:DNA-binding NarL/FixJ family response regulator
MQAWQVIRVDEREVRPGDYRAEVVVALRSDAAAGVLRVGDRLRAVPRTRQRDCPLTPRELEILQHLAAGLTYKQIAVATEISPCTVRTHLHYAYSKLGITDRAQAVLKAVAEGWI